MFCGSLPDPPKSSPSDRLHPGTFLAAAAFLALPAFVLAILGGLEKDKGEQTLESFSGYVLKPFRILPSIALSILGEMRCHTKNP